MNIRDMHLDKYDDKSPRWLTAREKPPLQLWAEHFLRPSKKRNILYTKYLEKRLAACKSQYGFLTSEQIFGLALADLNIPTCGFKIKQHFFNRYKTNREPRKCKSRLSNVDSRSYCLFEVVDTSSNVDDDFHLQMRAPPHLPRDCYQDEAIYDNLKEIFEDVQIQPFESLTRRTRPSDICPNDNRKNKRPKGNRLLNQFEIFKGLTNYSCGLSSYSNRKEETGKGSDVIIEKSSVTNISILKRKSFKETVRKSPIFEKSVRFNENLGEIHLYCPFEESESYVDSRSSIIDVDVERNLCHEDSSKTFLVSSLNESSSTIKDDDFDRAKIEGTKHSHSESIEEVPETFGAIREEQDSIDKNHPLNVGTEAENHITSPTDITNQSIKTEVIFETNHKDESLFLIEKWQHKGVEFILPHSHQLSLNDCINCNSSECFDVDILEYSSANELSSDILLKNESNETLDCGTVSMIQEDDSHYDSLQYDVAASVSSEQDKEDIDHKASIDDRTSEESENYDLSLEEMMNIDDDDDDDDDKESCDESSSFSISPMDFDNFMATLNDSLVDFLDT